MHIELSLTYNSSLSQFWSISTDKARVVGAAIARIYIVYNYHPVSVNLLGFRETFKTLFIVLGGQRNVVVSLCVPLYCSSMEIISTLWCKLNFNNGVYWEIFSKYSNHNLSKILAELVNTKPKWWIFLLYDTRCHSTEPEEVPSSLSVMASCLRTGNLVNLNFVSLSLRGFWNKSIHYKFLCVTNRFTIVESYLN